MTNARYEFRLLGTLTVTCAGRAVTRFRTQKTAALLAYLALFPTRSHPREELAARFWPDDGEEEARRSLRVALNSLRRQLETPGDAAGELFVADRHCVSLRREAFTTDIIAFSDALAAADRLARASAGDCEERTAHLLRAAALYESVLLPGFYDEWLLAERECLHVGFLRACAQGADLLRKLRRDAEADALLARRASSLSSADVIPPAPATSAGPSAAPAVNSPSAPATRPAPMSPLPLFFTRFCGRERESRELAALIADQSALLITLIGPGGVGKTRLSVEAARAWSGDAVFVPLSAVTRGEAIADAVCDALHTPAPLSGTHGGDTLPADRFDDLLEALRARAATGTIPLLLLDNFEQIESESGAHFVARLLRAHPGIRLVTSSRRRLNVPGERLIPVDTLPTPAPGLTDAAELLACPAVALFCDRARAVAPDFAVTARNAAAVGELCRLLGGLPLAIELAAAWASVFTPAQMAAKLGAQNERFDLLVARKADRVERHRSVWNVIAWSYDLLPPPLRAAWRRLAAFEGGFSAAMAITAGGDDGSPDALARLRERSLVNVMEAVDNDADEARYELPESLRQFAAERIAEEENAEEQAALHARHAQSLAAVVDAGAAYGDGPRTADYLRRYRLELPNIRAALRTALAGLLPLETGLHLAFRLSPLWRNRYPREGQEFLSALLERAAVTGEPVPANLRGGALYEAGALFQMSGDIPRAEEKIAAALALFRAEGIGGAISGCLQLLGVLALGHGAHDAAEDYFTQALEHGRERNTPRSIANSLNNLGTLAGARGDYAAMQRWHEQELIVREAAGDASGIAAASRGLALAAQHGGDPRASERFFGEAIRLYHDGDNLHGLAITFLDYAAFLAACDRWEEAARICGVAAALGKGEGIALPRDALSAARDCETQCRAAMRRAAFTAARERGERMRLAEVVALIQGNAPFL